MNQHMIKVWRYIIAAVLLLPMMAACGGTNQGTPASSDEPATITFAAWDYEREMYHTLAQRFTSEHPNIKVVVVPLEDLTSTRHEGPFSQIEMLRQVVSGADTALAITIAPEAFGTDLLLNLQPLMDADPNFSRDDFYPGTLEAYTLKGGTWILPRTFHTQILAYNRELFDAADLPEPEHGWSWNDALGVAEALAVKRGDTVDVYGLVDPSSGFLPFLGLLEEQGIDLLNTPIQDIELDSATIVAVAERIRSLGESGAIFMPQRMSAEAEDGAELPNPRELIGAGRVALWDDSYAMMGQEMGDSIQMGAESFPFEQGKVAYPTTQVQFTGGGSGYMISGGTQYPQAAWTWIEFLSRQELDVPQQGGEFQTPGILPARKSLAEKINVWESMDEETAETYLWSIEHRLPLPERSPDYLGMSMLGQAMMQVLSGQEDDIERALSEAQQELEEQLANMQLTPTAEPDTGPVVVATPEPQEAPEGTAGISFSSVEFSPVELRDINRAFRKEHPDIFVDIEPTQSFTGPLELAQLARTSDCFTAPVPVDGSTDASLLLDLQPLFDADATFAQSDYPSPVLNMYRFEGRLLGLPLAFHMRTLNYNQTAFDDAGINTPSAGWTMDDFLAAARALTSGSGDDKQYGYIPLGFPPMHDMQFFIRQHGASMTTGSGEHVYPNFDDPQVVEAIQWYLDLALVHEVMPTPNFPYRRNDQYNDETYQMVEQGRAGMWFDYGYGMFGPSSGPPMEMSDQPQRDFEVRIAPLPLGSAGLTGQDFTTTSGLYISADSQNPDACWEWLKYLSGNMTLIRWGIPARTSVAESEAFLQQASPDTAEMIEITQQIFETAETSEQMQASGTQYIETYWLFKALTQVIEEDEELEIALQEAQETTSAFVDCTANGGKPARCAQEVDPTYEGYLQDVP